MSNNSLYKEAIKKYLPILEQYVPVVARVHGNSHQEFYEIVEQFNNIKLKIKENGPETADLKDEFTKLREISDNYTVPGDVCESYKAVYQMLALLDQKYNS
jgi:iron-sulfur cluster repair protein YtfE (RIC family)